MAVVLSKGGNVSLTKEAPGLKRIQIGLGWDVRSTDGQDFDLDAMAFMLTSEGRVRNDSDFIFFNQLKSACGHVQHMGDNRTGAGDGDDESIKVNLEKLTGDITRISLCVIIYEGVARNQNFGGVRNAYIRIINDEDGKELARYDLSEDYAGETAMIFGEVYRHNGDWKFKAVGQGYREGFAKMVQSYGVNA